MSISSSFAASLSKGVGFFHHFQLVNLWSSIASWTIAVERTDILPSIEVGYRERSIIDVSSL
jgi:hypothetical protein